jgi:hypothetical protein
MVSMVIVSKGFVVVVMVMTSNAASTYKGGNYKSQNGSNGNSNDKWFVILVVTIFPSKSWKNKEYAIYYQYWKEWGSVEIVLAIKL